MLYDYNRFLVVVFRADRILVPGRTGIRNRNPERRAAIQLYRRT